MQSLFLLSFFLIILLFLTRSHHRSPLLSSGVTTCHTAAGEVPLRCDVVPVAVIFFFLRIRILHLFSASLLNIARKSRRKTAESLVGHSLLVIWVHRQSEKARLFCWPRRVPQAKNKTEVIRFGAALICCKTGKSFDATGQPRETWIQTIPQKSYIQRNLSYEGYK